MVATYVFEFGSTGRRSMVVFQTLLAGRTAQPLSVWPTANGLAAQTRANPTIARSVRRSNQPPWKTLHSSVGTSCAARQVASTGRRRPLHLPDGHGAVPQPEQAAEDPRERACWESG